MEIVSEEIKKVQDVAKLQQIGTDRLGRPKFMLYITRAARSLNLQKGDKIVFSIYKIGHEDTLPLRNPKILDNLENSPIRKKIPIQADYQPQSSEFA